MSNYLPDTTTIPPTRRQEVLLNVEDLSVFFTSGKEKFVAVDDVSFSLKPGEVLGIVGESGSGKSTAALALMGLIAPPGKRQAKVLEFAGENLLAVSPRRQRELLGENLSMIFQDPTTSLDPCFTVASQIMEVIAIHTGGSRQKLRQRALELLHQVEIPDAEKRLDAYPHQLSVGMCQRVMIAMAIACRPRLLIADEPTTALDVTIQLQIIRLLLKLQHEQQMAILLISHDLGVVSQMADRVLVMYSGQIVESALVESLFSQPRHPYTEALLKALPENNPAGQRLTTLPGIVPGLANRPLGCLLEPRCPKAQSLCREQRPQLSLETHAVRCFYPNEAAG